MSVTKPVPGPVGAFGTFIRDRDFPCVGAKSALGKGQLTHVVLEDMRSGAEDRRLLRAFYAFVKRYREDRTLFTSFAVSWQGPTGLSERDFERLLWERLQALHELDRAEQLVAEAGDPHMGALASELAGEIYGLDVLARDHSGLDLLVAYQQRLHGQPSVDAAA